MNKLKTMLKSTLAKNPLDIIFWGEPTRETFREALQVYESEDELGKKNIEERALRKLHKQKETRISLSILYLFDCLLKQAVPLKLSCDIPKIDLSGCESRKEQIAQKNFYELYYKYLRLQSSKPYILLISPTEVNEDLICFCEFAEQSIHLILQMDFLLLHCLRKSKEQILVRLIISSILTRIYSDLKFLNTFINQNSSLILEKHEFSFRINHIYEKAIFFTKQADKFKSISKAMNSNQMAMPLYEFNPELNRKIEKEMYERDEERKEFYSQKYIRSAPTILAKENGMRRKFDEDISEDSILVDNDEFLI